VIANRPYRHQQGIAYIAVLIAVAIIGLFAGGAVQTGIALERRAAEQELLFVGAQFHAAFKTYYEATPNGSRRYPNNLDELLRDPRFPSVRRHLRKIFPDPLTGRTEWGLVRAPEGGVMGVYSLAVGSPVQVAEFPEIFSFLEDKTRYSDWVFGYLPIQNR
jgi:type II secretory pathway pseudopilin PulG